LPYNHNHEVTVKQENEDKLLLAAIEREMIAAERNTDPGLPPDAAVPVMLDFLCDNFNFDDGTPKVVPGEVENHTLEIRPEDILEVSDIEDDDEDRITHPLALAPASTRAVTEEVKDVELDELMKHVEKRMAGKVFVDEDEPITIEIKETRAA
jgi:hypothetical protein